MKIVVWLFLVITFALYGCTQAAAVMSSRLVVVSGGNRGVGMGICRQVLACDATAEVVVTARQLKQAESLCREVNQLYDTVRAHPHALDVTNDDSCQALAAYVQKAHTSEQRPLTLVNNAGVAYDLPWFPTPWPVEAAARTLDVNLYGAERLTRALLPCLLRSSDGRVINVSSGGGRANMSKMSSDNRSKLLDEAVTWDDIQAMATMFTKEYETAAKAALVKDAPQLPFLSPSGWWLQSYGFSKACLGSYTQLLARNYASQHLLSMACSPGFIATDMSASYPQYDTLKTVDEGGAFVAKLATCSDRTTLQSGVFYQPGNGVVSFVADS